MANNPLTPLEQRLSLLVAMQTETRRRKACQQAIDSLAEECRTLGMYVHAYGGQHPSMVATTRKTKKPKLMLVAHIDVVPTSHSGQFTLQVEGDKLKGRGAYDMKFAAACFLEFLHEYAGQLQHYNLGVMFTSDEEIGGFDGVAKLLKDEGWRTDVAYIPDSSSGLMLEEKAKGTVMYELTVTGRTAHSSRPWDGDNALVRLTALLGELQALYPLRDKFDTTLSINRISGGDAMNQVPGKAEAWIDVRSFSKTELTKVEQHLKKLGKKHNVSYKQLVTGEPLVIDKDSPYVQQFHESFQQIVGRECSYFRAHGATDGRWFAKYGIPCLIIAPDGGDFHGPDEWVSRPELAVFYDLTVDYINRVHGVSGEADSPVPAKRNLLKRMFKRAKS